MSGKVAAFAHYGVVLRNDQWSWSGRTPSGEVVVTLWRDEFNYRDKPVSYSTQNSQNLDQWVNRPGNQERIENLKWARDKNGGRFRVVIATAVDTAAEPRSIKEAYPQPKMIMQLLEFNEETGEFKAELVESADARRS